MKKIFILVTAMSFGTTSAQAFLIEEHCDDFEAFEVSDERACSDICPNRKVSTKLGGTLYEHYSCYNSKRDKGGEYDVIDAVSDFATDYCYYRYGETPKEEVLDKKGCVKKAIEEGRDFIAVFTLNPSDEQELCSEKNGYELEDGICFKKCPKDKPLTGYAHDCYSCDTKYAIELDNFKGYSIKDEEFVNVCPNRAIIGGTSFKNQIDSCNTIEKVKKILADEEKYYQEDEDTNPFSLLEWNVMFNHNPEVIEYLLDNEPSAKQDLSLALTLAIDKKAPESIMKLLLERAKKEDLTLWIRYGYLYDVSLESGSGEVPMSFYAKHAGASESIQNLIKSYEKKFGIDYEPKIGVSPHDKYVNELIDKLPVSYEQKLGRLDRKSE